MIMWLDQLASRTVLNPSSGCQWPDWLKLALAREKMLSVAAGALSVKIVLEAGVWPNTAPRAIPG